MAQALGPEIDQHHGRDDQQQNGADIAVIELADRGDEFLTDTTSATSITAARNSCHNILYTVVNSRAYAPENLNKGLENWKIVLIAVDVLLGALLVFLELRSIKKYRKNKLSAQ